VSSLHLVATLLTTQSVLVLHFFRMLHLLKGDVFPAPIWSLKILSSQASGTLTWMPSSTTLVPFFGCCVNWAWAVSKTFVLPRGKLSYFLIHVVLSNVFPPCSLETTLGLTLSGRAKTSHTSYPVLSFRPKNLFLPFPVEWGVPLISYLPFSLIYRFLLSSGRIAEGLLGSRFINKRKGHWYVF
jgi:hypothetical protein